MRHRVAGRKLGRNTAQRKALFRNLAMDLFRHGKITTTEAKAKSIRPQAERLITLAKRGDLHARRLAAQDVSDPVVLRKLFGELAEHFESREGGYVRMYKLGPRRGDAAPMVVMSLVDYEKE